MLEIVGSVENDEFEELADRYSDRINAIKSIRIQNDRTISTIKQIRVFMKTAAGNGDSAGASLTAPTRGGKTTIIEEFRTHFEKDPKKTSDQMPIVYVEIPSGAGTSSLGTAILDALGDMSPGRGDGAYKQMLIEKTIKRRGTKLLIIDETSGS